MSALTDKYIDDDYDGLLHSNAEELPVTGQEDIYDGLGNKSSLKLGRACEGATICGPLTLDNLIVNGLTLINAIYPIGSVYFSVLSINPATTLGGTWEQIAIGRFIAGVGSTTDKNGLAGTVVSGNNTTGEYAHTLTEAELPAHVHAPLYLQYDEDDNPDPSIPAASVIINNKAAAGGAIEQTNSTTASTGGGLAHNNLPPTFGMYVFKRTA